MQILQLTKFYPPFRGGIESVVRELASGLVDRGLAVDVLCANHAPGPTTREIRSDGTRVTRVHSFGRFLSTSMAPAMLIEMLRQRKRHDVIHVHLPDPLTNLALRLARPSAHIVVHWHSDIIHQKTALRLYAPLQQWLLRRANAIVVTSEAYGHASPWLRDHADKVHVVPIGIRDVSEAPDAALIQRIRGRYGRRKLIFALGRLVYYKGFEHLVRAARNLPEDHAVVIGGIGELQDSLQKECVALGVADRVILAGNIPEDEIQAHFHAADLFCLPSTARSEAFGVVLLEAMRCGKPVVATNIPGSGVSWVNQHGVTGLNVEPGDSLALANAIRTITDDPAIATRYGDAARQRFATTFTADAMVDAIERVYRRLVDESTSQSRLVRT